MGDRTWMQITFAKKDLKVFEKELDCGEDESFVPGITIWFIHEVNYGGYDELERLAKAKATFTAEHGAGGDYGGFGYACYQGDMAELAIGPDGGYLVSISEVGIDQESLRNAKRFFDIKAKVEKYFKDQAGI